MHGNIVLMACFGVLGGPADQLVQHLLCYSGNTYVVTQLRNTGSAASRCSG
jgi:hypothetical protein